MVKKAPNIYIHTFTKKLYIICLQETHSVHADEALWTK